MNPKKFAVYLLSLASATFAVSAFADIDLYMQPTQTGKTLEFNLSEDRDLLIAETSSRAVVTAGSLQVSLVPVVSVKMRRSKFSTLYWNGGAFPLREQNRYGDVEHAEDFEFRQDSSKVIRLRFESVNPENGAKTSQGVNLHY